LFEAGLVRQFLFAIFRPGGNDSRETSLGDRRTERFGGVANNERQNATLRVLAAEPVEALVEVGHRLNSRFGVDERIFKRRDDFCFVGAGVFEPLQVEPSGRRRAHEFVERL
jgi:hypothetical protein